MIIYIHGFGSCGEGSKAKELKKYFNSIGEDFISPSLSYVPELAIKTLEELILSYKSDVKLIGSSLGGYYSIFLSNKFNLKSVLINPSIEPFITLDKMIGQGINYYDNSLYEWNKQHIEMLKEYITDLEPYKEENFLLLLQKGDDLLDYKEAIKKLPSSKIILENNGSHKFEGIERYFKKMSKWLK